MDLFVYGTLTDIDLLRALTGREFTVEPARLDQYERVVPTNGYPFVRPRAGESVHGLLIRDVDPEALRRIDEYEAEGELYFRKTVSVRVGETLQNCSVYAVNEALITGDGAWKVSQP